jgi:hypothetical protein
VSASETPSARTSGHNTLKSVEIACFNLNEFVHVQESEASSSQVCWKRLG